MNHNLFIVAISLFLPLASSSAQTSLDSSTRQIAIDTRRGTWMSLDVSPDGKTIVFDLLGDIYSIPSTGGEATRLTPFPKSLAPNSSAEASSHEQEPIARGQPMDVQPRFSPDGKSIVFISDRDGADNVYIMNADGAGLRQISFGRDMHTSPTWSRDGASIAVRRARARPNAFVGSSGELVTYEIASGKSQVVAKQSDLRDVSGMEFSPDGRSIYVAVPVDPVRNEIPHGRTFQIHRVNRLNGSSEIVTDNFGGAIRPRITPDGRTLTYATYDDGKTDLIARDLATTREKIVAHGIEASAVLAGLQLDVLPGYGFSPDGRFAYVSYGGGIHRVSMIDGTSVEIPFHVKTVLQVGPENRISQKPFDTVMPVRMLNWPQFSSDRKHAVFEAIGKVWIVDGKGGAAHRLDNASWREYAPSISPDGKWVAYVTWSDSLRGNLFKVPLGGGTPVRLTREAGYYANPSWSRDGSRIVMIVGGNADLRGLDPTQDMTRSLAWISSSGGEIHTVMSSLTSEDRFGGFQDIGAQFSHDGSRLWYVTGDGSELRSIALDGTHERRHLTLVNPQYQVATYIAVSPDEKHIAFTAGNDEVWLIAMPDSAASPSKVDIHAASGTVTRISSPAGYAPRWIDEHTLSWAFSDTLYTYNVVSSSASLTRVQLTANVPSGHGAVALTNARIITMKGDEVIERGTIVIRDNRIVSAGPAESVKIPDGARIISLDGKTIVPGFMDLHDHGFGGSAIRNWPDVHRKGAAKLAYGVTLSRDLSAPIQAAFSITELINSGASPGPRAYAAGEPVLPAIVEIHTLDEALNTVQMMKDLGAVVLKEYLQPTRYQRQLVGEAARRRHLMITAEGSLDYKNNLSMLLDGYTSTEHMWAPFPLYEDVGQLMAKTGFFYTPTIGTSASGSEHWYARMPVDTDPRQQRFILHSTRESLARRVKMAKIFPEWETVYDDVTHSVARLAKEGARINTGSHDVPTPSGLGLHWEIWSYVDGGMKPIDALRAATITGAEALGMSHDLGSIEPGKLADLLVLDANPLEDIHNTLKLTTVMRNGVPYDSKTLEKRLW
jgi:Tol biopolymer transport system component